MLVLIEIRIVSVLRGWLKQIYNQALKRFTQCTGFSIVAKLFRKAPQ